MRIYFEESGFKKLNNIEAIACTNDAAVVFSLLTIVFLFY